MIVQYLTAALEMAHYELIEDPEPYYGSVPGVQGAWATGKTLEDCRRNLSETLEDWILFSVARGEEVPPIGGITVGLPPKVA